MSAAALAGAGGAPLPPGALPGLRISAGMAMQATMGLRGHKREHCLMKQFTNFHMHLLHCALLPACSIYQPLQGSSSSPHGSYARTLYTVSVAERVEGVLAAAAVGADVGNHHRAGILACAQ